MESLNLAPRGPTFVATNHLIFFLAQELPLISKVADLLGIVVICAIRKAQFGSEKLGLHNIGCH